MAMHAARIVIVGAGQAGARAALAARSVNAEAQIIVVGAEQHLPYERPLLSKAMLLDPTVRPPCVLDAVAAAAAKIEVRPSVSAVSIDRAGKRVALTNGEPLDYDKLIIATGSRLRTISVPGAPAGVIHYVRTIEDSFALRDALRSRASLAVVGGGFIGLEVAAAARALGCAVTVIEAAPHLLARLGCPQASAFVERHHRERGVSIRLGVQCLSYESGGLRLSDGSFVAAELIVAGVGVSAAAELAEAAGLAVENGVLTDQYGRTSDPDIFAAGDVTNQDHPTLGRRVRLESWENANLQGAVAGKSAAGVLTSVAAAPWFWSDQGELNIQMAGVAYGVTHTIERGSFEDGLTIFQLRDTHLIGAITLNRGKDMALIRRMLGQLNFQVDPHILRDVATPLRTLLRAR